MSAVTAPRAGEDRLHCIVVGAGIVGSACAWQLARRGMAVTLIDRVPPGQSTSFGNAACLSPSHVVPFSYPGVWKKLPRWLGDPLGPLTVRWRDSPWVGPWLLRYFRAGTQAGVERTADAQAALMHRVVEDYDQLLEACGLKHLLQARGALAIYDSVAEFEAERWIFELEAQHGFDYRVLDEAERAALVPALKLDGGVAVLVPSWQHVLDPAALTAGIADAACAAGGRFVAGSVSGVAAGVAGVTVTVDDGHVLRGDRLLIAAGAWSNRLATQLGDPAVPMTAKRGYHSMVAAPGVELSLPVLSNSRGFVMTPLADGLRLAGTAEFARLDAAPDYRRARVLVDHARHYLPELQAGEVTEWMGQRPMISDSLPVIGPSPRHAQVAYAFGHGHYGLTQGATTARLIADLVQGQDPVLDLAHYRMDRF